MTTSTIFFFGILLVSVAVTVSDTSVRDQECFGKIKYG